MSKDIKTYIQEVTFLTEQPNILLQKKIDNQPMSIPYKVGNTVHFLTPPVKDDNHHLRVQYGNEKEKTKLEKFFINPTRTLTKKTLSHKGADIEFKDLQDHFVFLVSYKKSTLEEFKEIVKKFPDKVKNLTQEAYDKIEDFAEQLGEKSNQEFTELKYNLKEFKTQWNIYREPNSAKKLGKKFTSEFQKLYKKIKEEINTLNDDVNSLFEDEETEVIDVEKNSLEKLPTTANKPIYNTACKLLDKFEIQTGMIYYINNENLYCIYRGDNHYLKAFDKLIALMNPQELAIQNRNPHDSLVKNQNTLTRNHRGNDLQLFKKTLIVVSILVTAGLIGALIAAATVLFSPFIALALIPVLGISSLGLYKVCKKAEVVSVDNSLSQQPPKFKSKYLHARVIGNVDVISPAGPSHDAKADNNPNPNDDRTTTASFKGR